MSRTPRRSRLRPLAWPALVALLLQPVLPVVPAAAALRVEDEAGFGRARLVAPAPGERAGSAAIRFAYELPADAARALLVVGETPFDGADPEALLTRDDLKRIDARGRLRGLDDLGLAPAAEATLYWTILTQDAARGTWRAAEVRSFTALPRFGNRVAHPGLLAPVRNGRLDAATLASRWGEARPAGAAGAPDAAAAAPRIRLAAGYDFAPSVALPDVPLELSSARAVPVEEGGSGLVATLVQFATPPSDADRDDLAAAGAAVFAYVPDQAYLVRMSPEARARLAASGRAAWIGDWQPAYKLSPLFGNAAVPPTGRYMALLFPDAEPARAAAALAARGFTVEQTSDNGVNRLVRFTGPEGGLAAVAGLSDVAWLEPVVPKVAHNDNAQWVVQTNVSGNRRVWDMGIRGQGQIVNTSDSGINVTHDQFRDPAVSLTGWGDYPTHRKIVGYQKGSTSSQVAFGDHGGANSYHGSHTAGTIAGSDDPVGGVSARDGMAKDARIYFMDISGSTLANSVLPFDDLNDLFLPPYTGNAAGGARVSSHSWGAAVFGAYDLNAMQVDQFVWDHPDFYIAFSNGNSGSAGSVGSPASAKNLAGMGGTQNGTFAGNLYTSTSRGPTQDGRRKPLFAAPGQSVVSAQLAPSSYASLSGTSMASPAGTGAVVLMRQYLTDGWYPTGAPVPANSLAPSAALLKAMAINSSESLTSYTLPDNNIGWGRVHADNVLYFPGDARRLLLVDHDAGLGQGAYVEYQVNVVDGALPLRVSLCWSDYPGNPAAAMQRVNDLDLIVTNGVTTYRGNVFSGGFSITGGVKDAVNVEEAVRVNAPATGVWTVRIEAPVVPVGPQPFGLCITGGVGQAAGAVALDRAEYGSTSTVELQVIDTDAIAPVQVTVASNTEAAGETVTLAGANGVWTGSIALTPAAAQAADGVLSVSHGDDLTATYNDASPAAALVAQARVSYGLPAISNVGATSQGAAGTLVTWSTDRNATSRVYYGLTPALELGFVDGTGARLSHQVLLSSVTPGATYYYDVESVALNGNAVRDDRGGLHYQFTANGSGDVLLLLGEPGFSRLAGWQSALGANTYDYDTWSGPLADSPLLGDRNAGLRSYRAVIWQTGFEVYPPISDLQAGVITNYLNGGGRLWIVGHDIAWALGDPTSPVYTTARRDWLANTLRTTYQADPASWSWFTGYAGDPISGGYVAGLAYEPFRSGGAGDEVDVAPSPGGTTAYLWRNNDTSPDDCGFRWESAVPNGSGATALWGGTPSRMVTSFFEFTAMDAPYAPVSAVRNDILDKTLLWLLGRARPTVQVTAPNGGEVLTGTSTAITWTESVAAGRAVAERVVEYSVDGGDSWVTLSSNAGPSPYTWDLTLVPNSNECLVRVRIVDDGVPASLSRSDRSNALFTIDRPGGDTVGPIVAAGSIVVSPNPVVAPDPATLAATISDQSTGASGVAAAEWSFGATPAAAGAGTAMTGAFGGVTVAASVNLDTTPFPAGPGRLWVRGQDSQGNWGPAAELAVQVNGGSPVDSGRPPAVAFLRQNVPNPFAGAAGTAIRFGLSRDGRAELGVYALSGRLVRRLASGPRPAGEHVAQWDGRDDAGVRAAAGVYFYVLRTDEGTFEKRMLLLP